MTRNHFTQHHSYNTISYFSRSAPVNRDSSQLSLDRNVPSLKKRFFPYELLFKRHFTFEFATLTTLVGCGDLTGDMTSSYLTDINNKTRHNNDISFSLFCFTISRFVKVVLGL